MIGSPLMKIDLKHIRRDRDRHGNARIYLRVPGRPQVRLREVPGTAAFLAEYQAALEAVTAGGEADEERHLVPGSLRWLCAAYYRTPEFRALDPSTKSVRRAHLDSICASRIASGEPRGALPYRGMKAKNVRKIRDEWAARGPEAANGRIKALRALYVWAMSAGHVDHNPTRDVPKIRGSSEGFHSWTLEEVEQYRARHPIGTKARLALELLLFTGTRRSDVVKLGRQMVRDGWFHWTEAKGRDRRRKDRAVPILPVLQATVDASPIGDLIYLVTEFGKPFTVAGFGNKMRDWCNQAGLPRCSAHGLRKAGATIAADNGATSHELMAIFGWETLKQAELYTRRADRKRLAGKAMHLLVPVPPETEMLSHLRQGTEKS
jgi:integrase